MHEDNHDGQSDRRRLLFLGGNHTDETLIQSLSSVYQVDQFEKLDDAMKALRDRDYHAVFSDAGDFLPLERSLVGQKANLVLNTIGEGVCIVDADGQCTWSNMRMRQFSPEVYERVTQTCCQARLIFAQQASPQTNSSLAQSKKFTFQANERYFELMTSPVTNDEGKVVQIVAVVWDATSGKRLQQKIDAIDSAGRELSRIEGDSIMKLAPADRLTIMQDKIIKFSHDLMHFDHFAIRLLDKRTNKLEVVIAEGLPGDALDIDLYAQPEGNGISGYVAATGRSYICHDTEKDPRYVLGLDHCKSTLTVPLRLFDKVIGVYNIESARVGEFTEDDRQFAEIFGRYVAMALNILDLLVVERFTTTGTIAESVVQEINRPLGNIITEAQSLMEDYIGDDLMRKRLYSVVENVESIRQSLRAVKEGQSVIVTAENEKPCSPDGDPVLAGKRILIADDEQNIRHTIADILRKHGCVCEVCKDGFEAVNVLNQQTFDLIVSDIKMPYRNGYEIFAAARRISDDLPVILMTGFGYDPHHSIVRATQEGLASVLFKPFKVDQLLEEIRKAFGVEPEEKNEATVDDAKDEANSNAQSDAASDTNEDPTPKNA